MPRDFFHLGMMLMLSLACAAALAGRAYQDGTRNVTALVFCALMGFSGPVIGLVVFAPVMQVAWHTLWSSVPTSLPGLVSMRGEFLVLGFFIGLTIATFIALTVARNAQK